MTARCLASWIALVLAITGSAAIASPAPPHLTVNKSFGKVAGWSIGYSESLGGCLAAASYGDDTTIWFGFSSRGSYLAFTNPRWHSIEVGGEYDILMNTRHRRWRGTFTGFAKDDGRGLFESGLNERFIIDLSSAGAIAVVYQGRQLATLSLVGSTDAFEAVVGCQKEMSHDHPKGEAAEPEAPHKLEAGMASTGTGFFVSERGHVLTNNHVIDACSEYIVRQPGSVALKARLVARDEVNDLAVLSTDVPQKVVPPLSIRARIGESVFVYGFPHTDVLASTGNFTIGNVTATAGMRDDTRSIQISAPVHMGNSGGPVLDQYGNVIGVIQSKASAAAFGDSHDVPQNVNFAIKATIALNFLESSGIEAPITVRNTDPMDGEQIAERSKIFVVQVICH